MTTKTTKHLPTRADSQEEIEAHALQGVDLFDHELTVPTNQLLQMICLELVEMHIEAKDVQQQVDELRAENDELRTSLAKVTATKET